MQKLREEGAWLFFFFCFSLLLFIPLCPTPSFFMVVSFHFFTPNNNTSTWFPSRAFNNNTVPLDLIFFSPYQLSLGSASSFLLNNNNNNRYPNATAPTKKVEQI